MENLNLLRQVVKENINITKRESTSYLNEVDNNRYANIEIKIETENDIFIVKNKLILKYKDKIVEKEFHSGDMPFKLSNLVNKLEIEEIDLLPNKPIKVFVKSNIKKDEGSEIKYKTPNYIASGIVNKIGNIKPDGIEYFILINDRVKLEV